MSPAARSTASQVGPIGSDSVMDVRLPAALAQGRGDAPRHVEAGHAARRATLEDGEWSRRQLAVNDDCPLGHLLRSRGIERCGRRW